MFITPTTSSRSAQIAGFMWYIGLSLPYYKYTYYFYYFVDKITHFNKLVNLHNVHIGKFVGCLIKKKEKKRIVFHIL